MMPVGKPSHLSFAFRAAPDFGSCVKQRITFKAGGMTKTPTNISNYVLILMH